MILSWIYAAVCVINTTPSLASQLATDNQMSQLVNASHESRVYRRQSRVYGQYTRHDHAMGNTEKILQYYKYIYIYIYIYMFIYIYVYHALFI